MKPLLKNILVLLFLLPALVHSHNVKIPKDIKELKLTKMTENVYVVHGIQSMPNKTNKGFISNSGIVISQKGVVIVDTGGSLQIGEMLLTKIKEVTDKPVVAVFNTHLHGDHWMGNAAIRKAYPDVNIYSHERAIKRLKNGEAEQWLDIFAQATGNDTEVSAAVLPDMALKGGEKLELAGNSYKVHYAGHAHTDNDIMIEFPGEKTLFAGDVVTYGSIVSSARPEDFSAKGQIKALEYALTLPIDLYVPGHGPTGGREIPEATKRFLEVFYASVQNYYDEGLSDFEMRDQVVEDLKEFKDWSGFDGIGRSISFIYQQVEAADFE